jgi:sugar phosphate isomerase/epimerase
MKLGAAQWPFKFDPPYDGAIKQIAGLGLKAVELVVWDPGTLHSYYTPETIRSLRSSAESLGLEIAEFVGTPADLAHPDTEKREAAVAYFAEVVEVAKQFGTKIVNSIAPFPFSIPTPWLSERSAMQQWSVDYPAGLDWGQNWRDYVEATKRCVGFVEDAGLVWAIEPHPYRYVANTAGLQRLIDQVDSEVLGCNVDPSHLFPVAETPHASVYALGSRVFNCHISDNWGESNAHFRPGKGRIDWGAFLRALRDIGFDGIMSLELEDTGGVSRGARPHAGARSLGADDVANESFVEENRKSIKFLAEVAQANGIEIEGCTDNIDALRATAV